MFRNNVGIGWTGQVERVARAGSVAVQPGDVVVRQARPFHAGLAEGSADLIGIQALTIGPEHIGRTLGVFISLEVKTPTGKPRQEQLCWQEMIRRMGGKAEIVRSEDEAKGVLEC